MATNIEMPARYAGGCACGNIRYEVSGEPVAMNHCQCRQCQRDSGTGHGSHIAFRGADIQRTGEPREWDMIGEMGTVKRRAFCGTCGAPVYMTFPDMPDFFVISAASLDEPERFVPNMVFWTAAALEWDSVDPKLQRFEKLPPQPEPAANE